MGKMNELAVQLTELKRCGEVLISISEALNALFSEPATEETTAEKDTAQAPIPLEDVRTVLAQKSRVGYTAEVKALLIRHGADRLSGIDPAEYPALLAEAEVL